MAALRSARDGLAALVIDPHDEERVRPPLVVDAKRREGPAVDALAVAEDVLCPFERLVASRSTSAMMPAASLSAVGGLRSTR